MNLRLQSLACLSLAFFAIAPVGAQTPPASPVAMPKVPAHNCVRPEFPGRLASNTLITAFNRETKVFEGCIKDYIESSKKLAEAAVEAGNKAINDYNSFADELKAQAEARK